MTLREKTEAFFESWSEVVVRHRWPVLIFVLGFTFSIIPQLQYMWMDFSTEAYLPQKEKTVIDYDNFRMQFGYSGTGLISIETEESVFTLENLARLKKLQTDIEENVPHIEEITSLVSVRHTSGENDGLTVKDLEELWPQREADIPAFKEMVLNNPNYLGNIVSEDGKLTNIAIKLNNYTDDISEDSSDIDSVMEGFDDEVSGEEKHTLGREDFLKPEEETEFAEILIDVALQHEQDGFKIHTSGMPVINYKLAIDTGASLQRNMGIGVVILTILLFLLFQRLSGVLMPIMVVTLSMLTTMALMPLFNIPFMGSAQILPTFLLAVGIADSLHILSIFFLRYDEGAEKDDAIIFAMRKTSVAVLMTTATTAAGLMSFAFADLRPTQMLGIFGSAGVFLALVYTMALIPALLSILPIKRKAPKAKHKQSFGRRFMLWVDRVIYHLGEFGVSHAKSVFAGSVILALLSGWGASKLYMSHDPIRWYPEDHPIRVAAETIDDKMSGTMVLEVVFDSGKENGLYDPAMLRLLENAETIALEHQQPPFQIKKVNSILSVVKENHKVLHDDNPDYYKIPNDRGVIAQELLLFENSGSDDLEELTDSTFRIARLTMVMPWEQIIGVGDYLDELREKLNTAVDQSGLETVSFDMVGLVMIAAKTLVVMLTSTIDSYMIAFTLVGLLMFLLMGGFRKGLLAFTPNIVPILFTLGMMGWFDIPLNLLTTMLGCIIIGISVDDTIHFMHHYRKFIAEDNSPSAAVRKTLQIAGRAITFTSIVLVGCFMVYTLDTFLTSIQFGILLSFSITIALLANLVLAPALLTLFWKYAAK